MKTETEAGKAVKWVAPKPPYIGYKFTHHRLGNVKVIAIHPLGTIDVENIGTGNCYRITGLPLNGVPCEFNHGWYLGLPLEGKAVEKTL